jgi:hypothetical protein
MLYTSEQLSVCSRLALAFDNLAKRHIVSSCFLSGTTRRQRTLIAFSLTIALSLSISAAGQDKTLSIKLTDQKQTVAQGETVSEIAKDLWHVFQAKDGLHWFAS